MRGEANSSRSEISRWLEIIRVYITFQMRLEIYIYLNEWFLVRDWP